MVFLPEGRAKRLARSAAAVALSKVAVFVTQLLQVPLFLHFWPTELYGEWLILISIPVYLELVNIGLPSATTNEMAMRASRSEFSEANGIFNATFLALSSVFGLCLLLAIIFAAIFNHPNIGLLAKMGPSVLWVGASLIAYVGLGQISLGLSSGLIASGFNYVSITFSGILRIIELAGIGMALYLGAKPISVAFTMVVIRTLGVAAQTILLRIYSSWIVFDLTGANWLLFRGLLKGGAGYLLWAAGNAVSMQGYTFAVGTLFGAAALVSFNTTRTLTRITLQFALGVNDSVYAETSAAFGAGDFEAYKKFHNLSCQLSFWLAVIVVAGVFILGPFVYIHWTAGRLSINYWTFVPLLASVLFQALWFTSSISLSATNRHLIAASGFFIINCLGLALTILVGSWFGAASPAIILMLTDAVTAAFILSRTLPAVGSGAGEFFSTIFTPPIKPIEMRLRRVFAWGRAVG